MKKILLLIIAFFYLNNVTNAEVLNCATKGNYTNCTIQGRTVLSITTQKLYNGLVEVKTCSAAPVPPTFMNCEYEIMTPMRAKDAVREAKNMANVMNLMYEEEAKKAKIEKENKSKILKRVEITTNKGTKIALEEDNNFDDFVVINGKRKSFGNKIASKRGEGMTGVALRVNYPELGYNDVNLNEIVINAMKEDIYKKGKRTYTEIILGAEQLGKLFKTVYQLRINNDVSYEDAQKLMTFGYDNGNYKPEHLLLPKEIAKYNYDNYLQEAHKNIEKIEFP